MMTRIIGLFILLCLAAASADAQVKPSRYESDLQRFHLEDSISPPLDQNIVFIGSSSFTLWKDVNSYFPSYPILNRAYGGSCLTDLINDFNRLVRPYQPKQVVIYCGENDLASDTTLDPSMVVNRFKEVFRQIRNAYPAARITYVSMKPSPSRWSLKDKYIVGNKGIRKYLKKQKNCSFVDVWNLMLGKDGLPLPGIFISDDLHMNSADYALWQKAIQPKLLK